MINGYAKDLDAIDPSIAILNAQGLPNSTTVKGAKDFENLLMGLDAKLAKLGEEKNEIAKSLSSDPMAVMATSLPMVAQAPMANVLPMMTKTSETVPNVNNILAAKTGVLQGLEVSKGVNLANVNSEINPANVSSNATLSMSGAKGINTDANMSAILSGKLNLKNSEAVEPSPLQNRQEIDNLKFLAKMTNEQNQVLEGSQNLNVAAQMSEINSKLQPKQKLDVLAKLKNKDLQEVDSKNLNSVSAKDTKVHTQVVKNEMLQAGTPEVKDLVMSLGTARPGDTWALAMAKNQLEPNKSLFEAMEMLKGKDSNESSKVESLSQGLNEIAALLGQSNKAVEAGKVENVLDNKITLSAPGSLGNQISSMMETMAVNRPGQMIKVQLHPDNLGAVHLVATKSKHGLDVQMKVEKKEVMDELKKIGQELKDHVSEKTGVQIGALNIALDKVNTPTHNTPNHQVLDQNSQNSPQREFTSQQDSQRQDRSFNQERMEKISERTKQNTLDGKSVPSTPKGSRVSIRV